MTDARRVWNLPESRGSGCRPALAIACALLLAACDMDRSFDYRPPEQTLQAHGQTWTYSVVETSVRRRTLFSASHGLFGMREGHEEAHYLTNADGETIPAHERIYVLQKDGHYRKTACCRHFREEAEIYAFDERLVLVFGNRREFITDCFIHPNGRPDNEFEPDPGKRVYGPTIYAEFDPRDGTFKANTFDGGGTEQDIEAATRRKGRHLSIAEHEYVMYSKRTPFLCDDPRAARGTPRPADR